MLFQMQLINDVAEVMKTIDEERWEELEKHIAGGAAGTIDPRLAMEPLGADRAARLIEEGRSEVERERNITRTRQNLHLHIDKAKEVIRDALREVRVLADLGDVEYEGSDADTEHCPSEALRQLRLA